IIGQSYEATTKIQPDDLSLKIRRLDIGSNYLSTVGVDLITGRDFISDSRHDQEQAVIVNQKAVEALDLENDPINQQIFIEEQLYQIIGLVENHKEFGLRGEEPACVFTLADPDQFQYLSVSATEDQLTEVSEYLRQRWFQVNPMIPYEGFFQEMLIFKQIYMNNILRNLCLFLAIATLLMSAAGFFSLVSLRVLKRTKEISIRKVLGGSVSQMMRLIMNDFIGFVLIAFVVGSVLGYIVIQKVLFAQMYTYHIPFGIETFGFALLVMLLVPGITVGYKVYRTAVANPSETLKHE
ncbi:MAG: FtsX-like permease family protein, partial [Bacteroidota bacterium]